MSKRQILKVSVLSMSSLPKVKYLSTKASLTLDPPMTYCVELSALKYQVNMFLEQ